MDRGENSEMEKGNAKWWHHIQGAFGISTKATGIYVYLITASVAHGEDIAGVSILVNQLNNKLGRMTKYYTLSLPWLRSI
jgi:hypothetical protein